MSQEAEPLIYCQNWSGHRRSYAELFAVLVGGKTATGHEDGAAVLRECGSRPVLFATIDDHIGLYVATAIRRAVRGLATAGIFLRPQSCFGSGPGARAKRLLFAMLRRIPGVTTICIVPFEIEPRFTGVCNEAIYDPQFWDVPSGQVVAETNLSKEIRERADGRPIIAALGALAMHKGTTFLAQMLENEPALAEAFSWVCAGPVSGGEEGLRTRLRDAGVYLVDRFLSDEELDSIYGAADLVWACYAPAYDQASGVFGRALQYGKTTIVRRGALIERFAKGHGFDRISVPYDAGLAGQLLMNWASRPASPAFAGTQAEHAAMLDRWRNRSVRVLRRALTSRS